MTNTRCSIGLIVRVFVRLKAGYASTEAAQVYLAAYVQLGLFDEDPEVVNALRTDAQRV